MGELSASDAIPPELANPGKRVIAVRALDTGGWGGFHGPADAMRLAPNDAPGEAISLTGEWRYRPSTDRRVFPTWPNTRPHRNSPTVLYNAMIAPVIPYAIRGAICYQGESNRTRAEQYRTLFPTMIRDWRTRWGQVGAARPLVKRHLAGLGHAAYPLNAQGWARFSFAPQRSV